MEENNSRFVLPPFSPLAGYLNVEFSKGAPYEIWPLDVPEKPLLAICLVGHQMFYIWAILNITGIIFLFTWPSFCLVSHLLLLSFVCSSVFIRLACVVVYITVIYRRYSSRMKQNGFLNYTTSGKLQEEITTIQINKPKMYS